MLTKLIGQVDEQKHPKTRTTFRVAMDKWLRTHEVEETTRASYVEYARVHLYPAFGDAPVGRVTAEVLEEFYAELRRCRTRCDGRPFVEHRTNEPHQCRVVKHKRPPGRVPAAGYPQHDCAARVPTARMPASCRGHDPASSMPASSMRDRPASTSAHSR
jgi:integrase